MNESDYGLLLAPSQAEGEFAFFPQSNFTEGVFIDYRRFDAMDITPRFEFGFGLSYTTFSYSSLSVQASSFKPSVYPTGAIIPGGASDFWDTVARVTTVVRNTGSVTAAEVPQLYVGIPAQGQPRQAAPRFRQTDIAAGTVPSSDV